MKALEQKEVIIPKRSRLKETEGRDLNREFSIKETQMADKHSTLLVTKGNVNKNYFEIPSYTYENS